MLSARSSILLLACTAVLVAQLSGLHMHVNADGYVGQPEATHVHRAATPQQDGSHDHHADESPLTSTEPSDHEQIRDVPVVDPGAGVSKALIVLAWLTLVLIVEMVRGSKLRIAPSISPPRSHRDRWRPPLRAPPLTLSHSAS